MELLRTEGLSRSFGSLVAVDDVSFQVEEGELKAVIGPNGAGKSTFFKLISGELPPSKGKIWFKDREITGLPQHLISHLGIAKSYQITNVFPQLTSLENVRVAVQSRHTCYNFWSKAQNLKIIREKAEEILEAVLLLHKRDEMAANLSHGEQRHLEIGIALALDPVILLLDEPTAGMSPLETEKMMQLIRHISKGLSVVLVEHNMKVVMNISDRVLVLHQGKILAEGKPSEIRANDLVQKVYLGKK